MFDGAEPVEAAEVVHAVHAENPTAIILWRFELFEGAIRVKGRNQSHRGRYACAYPFVRHCRHRHDWDRRTCHCANGATAGASRTADCFREVQLTAAPALGAIPLAFIRNQFQYCSLICPFAVQGAITVPIAAAPAPAAFLGSLASTGSPLKAIGAAAASVAGPANAAVTPLINNDVFLVVPKAFHALDVAIVEAFNVGAAVFTPGEFIQAVQNGRANILDALNQPVGPPTTPTGATNILQVVAVEAVNVTTAVAFQAGELLLAGVVQIADATAQELARSGDPAAALAAGAAQTRQVVTTAIAPVVTAVNTAVTNIRNSLADPFPAAAKTTAVVQTLTAKTDEPKKPDTRSTKKASESFSDTKDADGASGEKPSHKVNAESPKKHKKDSRRSLGDQNQHGVNKTDADK